MMQWPLYDGDDYDDVIDSIVPALLMQRSLANRRSMPNRPNLQNHVHRQHYGGQPHHHESNHLLNHLAPMLAQNLSHRLSKQSQREYSEELANEKDKFKIMLDVQQFAPHEISVKVVNDFVVIEGSHEDKEDEHGWISRKFTRRYQIPKEWDIDHLSSKLSSDGVLTILAPSKEKTTAKGERVIQVHHTGKPACREKPQEVKKDQETKSQ